MLHSLWIDCPEELSPQAPVLGSLDTALSTFTGPIVLLIVDTALSTFTGPIVLLILEIYNLSYSQHVISHSYHQLI